MTVDNMELVNDKYTVNIKTDDTPYTVGSADNVIKYDVVINPSDVVDKGFYKTFCVAVQTSDKEYRIALVGSYYSFDGHCAVLDNDVLTVLQNDYILQIDLTDGSLINSIKIGDLIYYEIYRVPNKYIVYGELEILGLNDCFEQEWSFGVRDIITQFEIDGERIRLRDFEKGYYEIDLQGRLIDSSKNSPAE